MKTKYTHTAAVETEHAPSLRNIILAMFFICSFSTYAQSKQISLSAKNAPIKEVLTEVQQQSGYRILYNDEVVADDIRVSVEAENVSIKDLLDIVFQNTELTFIPQTEELIVITRKEFTVSNKIIGMVVDENNEPVPFANVVQLTLPDSTFINGVSTGVNGRFSLDRKDNEPVLLEITYLGYERFHMEVNQNTLGNIQLKPETTLLGEVVVIANRPIHKIDKGSLITEVSNSVLSKETNVTDVLRKIPGMMLQRGKLTSFSGGTPLIYINGKKAHSMNEVNQLEVKNIKKVRLNTNPGAEYDASVGAILDIITLNKLEGWSLQVDGSISRNQKWMHGEALKLNYKKENIDVFGTFSYDFYGRKSYQLIKTEINNPDTIWLQENELISDMSTPYFDYSAGVNYDINKEHSVGIVYDGYYNTGDDSAPFTTEITANNEVFATIQGVSLLKDKNIRHHVNAYYSGKINKQVSLDVFGDYARINSQRNQTVTESSLEYGDKNVVNANEATYNLYATNVKLSYMLNENHSVFLGSDWSNVQGNSSLEYDNLAGENARSTTNENKWAAYLSYYYQYKKWTANAGLRYENVNYNYKNLLHSDNSIKKTYNNLFPSLGITHNDKVVQSLSYRVGINRPDFGRLNNYSYYLNQFSQQEGNPQLQPQISHKIQYMLKYKFVYFSLGYTYNKDYIGVYYSTDSKHPERFVNTWVNFDKQQQLSAVLNFNKTFGIYNPSLTTMVMKNIQKVEYNGDLLTLDKPIWMIQLNNNVHFPNDILFNVEYNFRSYGSIQFFNFKPTHVFNVSLSKSWNDDNLQLTFKGKDIFRKEIDIYDGRINNIYFWQHEDQDRCNFSIHLTWRFNNYKKSYKGKSAATEELNRL